MSDHLDQNHEPSASIERKNGEELTSVIPVHAGQLNLPPNGAPRIATLENYRQRHEDHQASLHRWHRRARVHCSYLSPRNHWTLSVGPWDSILNDNSPPYP